MEKYIVEFIEPKLCTNKEDLKDFDKSLELLEDRNIKFVKEVN